MKERPILFSAPMVRAILAGKKTQTRRVVKNIVQASFGPAIRDLDGAPSCLDMAPPNWEICPYGVPGDRLYVRETWADAPEEFSKVNLIWYRADGEKRGIAWSPSIHMPRAFSRILLEITETRIERLQSITESDAIAEGVSPAQGMRMDDDLMVSGVQDTLPGGLMASYPVARYVLLWDSIKGTAPKNWNSNPWVWVVSFKRIAWPKQ